MNYNTVLDSVKETIKQCEEKQVYDTVIRNENPSQSDQWLHKADKIIAQNQRHIDSFNLLIVKLEKK